jgi:carboxyl-terminal processing protease
MSPLTSLASLVLLFSLSASVHAQAFPYEAQFKRLMGEPNETVSALAIYPWMDSLQISLPELSNSSHSNSIRIVSVERPVSGYTHWSHWSNSDGTAWADMLDFPSRSEATDLLRSAVQLHSGYRWTNQLLLFTNLCDVSKEAIGAALISPTGHLLNVGIKLKKAVCPEKSTDDSGRKSVDDGITQLQLLLQSIARQVLDPSYVTFDPKIAVKPDAVRVLRMAGFARLWSEVKYNFVYLDKRPDLDWDSILERYMPRTAAAQDDIEYGRILQEVIALLKDGHTNVYPKAVAPEDAPLVRLEPIQGKPVVVAVGNLPQLASLKQGMELLEIDHTPVQTIIQRDLDPYISSSTPQDRALREMRMILNGPPDSTIQTKWLGLDGQTIELTLHRDGSKNRAALPAPQRPRFEYKELPGQISYMALNDFSDDKIVGDFESNLSHALQAKAWILDLRENGGGDSSIGYSILSHFLNTPAQSSTWRTRLYNPTFQAWAKPQSWYEGSPDTIELAAGPRYSGPVYVLTSPSTCSAAEDFLIPLRMQKRATLVGEPTCGSTGQPLSFSIYGADVRICTKWDRFPDGTEFVGIGILPDIQVSRIKEDVSTGRDTVLHAVIQLASR